MQGRGNDQETMSRASVCGALGLVYRNGGAATLDEQCVWASLEEILAAMGGHDSIFSKYQLLETRRAIHEIT
ncbi:17644_t:CDS:1, partial [Acaulospora colombiana]